MENMKTVIARIKLSEKDYKTALAYINYMQRKHDQRYDINDYMTMLVNNYIRENSEDEDDE